MGDSSPPQKESSPPPVVKRQSSYTGPEESSGGSGMMQLLTGKNSKVAPAAAVTRSETSTSVKTGFLMLIPKKSDAVCIEMPPSAPAGENSPPDEENNPAQQHTGGGGQETNCAQQPAEAVTVKPTPSYDSYEEVCRICHDNPSKLELISPCMCKGSMNKVHRTCLERWLGESAKNSCEICGYEYNTVRKPKYTGCRSIYQWIRHPLSPSDTRNLFFDIACFFILTPLAAISSWLCVVGAQHYTFGEERRRRSKFHDPAWIVHGRPDPRADASNATWTSVGLLSLTGTLLVAYSVWLFVAIKYHIQAWRDWQQRNFTVTIVPFEDGCMGRPPPPRPPRVATPSGNNNMSNSNQMGERSSSSNNNSAPYNFFSSSGYGYDHLGVSSYLRYNGHSSLSTRGRGRSLIRHGGRRSRPRENYLNLPPIFSRSHFLRNPPPGYTISETALLYQALYGNDSDTVLNDNFLSFFADSSEDVTESSSMMIDNGSPSSQPVNSETGPEAISSSPAQPPQGYEIAEVHTAGSAHGSNNGVESSSSSREVPPQAQSNNNVETIPKDNANSSTDPQQPQPSKSKSEVPTNGNNDSVIIRIDNTDCDKKDKHEVQGDEIV